MNEIRHSFSSSRRISTVSFKCRYKTSFGSSLFVVGNLKLLGDWDINNAIALSTTPESYPEWILKDAFSCPVGTEIIYKYFVKDTKGTITWEILPNNANRKKIISKPGEFVIEDEENEIKETLGKTESYNSIISEIIPKTSKKEITRSRKEKERGRRKKKKRGRRKKKT